MTVYVALLRGVNVGGRGKVDMRELKQQVESLGCSDVSTYINSGNVIFRDRRSASTLTRELENALGRRVAVRSLAQVQARSAIASRRTGRTTRSRRRMSGSPSMHSVSFSGTPSGRT